MAMAVPEPSSPASSFTRSVACVNMGETGLPQVATRAVPPPARLLVSHASTRVSRVGSTHSPALPLRSRFVSRDSSPTTAGRIPRTLLLLRSSALTRPLASTVTPCRVDSGGARITTSKFWSCRAPSAGPPLVHSNALSVPSPLGVVLVASLKASVTA